MRARRSGRLALACFGGTVLAGLVVATMSVAQPRRPGRGTKPKPAPSASAANENPYDGTAAAAASGSASSAAPAAAPSGSAAVAPPPPASPSGGPLSPLNPAPNEFSDGGAPAMT